MCGRWGWCLFSGKGGPFWKGNLGAKACMSWESGHVLGEEHPGGGMGKGRGPMAGSQR